MNNTSTVFAKIKYLFIPFVVIGLGFIISYSFLHWLLVIKLEWNLKEDLVKFWLPIALAFIPVLIWIRPRVHRLRFKNDNGPFGYYAIAGFIIGLTALMAQELVVTSSGKLLQVNNLQMIPANDKSKYIVLQSYYADKSAVTAHSTAEVTGKYDNDLNFYIYVAMPLQSSSADSGKTSAQYWLGKWYHKKVSNDLSDQEKDEAYKSFAEETQKEFDTTSFSGFMYLERLGNNKNRDALQEALKKVAPNDYNNKVLLTGSYSPLEAQQDRSWRDVLIAWGAGSLIWLVMILIPAFKEKEETEPEEEESALGSLKSGLAFLSPRHGFFITSWLVIVNVVIFLIMVFSGMGFISFSGEDLVNLGGNYGPMTKDGQWWRLLTSIFLHGGIMHILANMYGLVFVGMFLEPVMGRWKYLMAYLTTGILASLTSLWWHDATVGVGASGAIFGLYGVFIAAMVWKVFPTHVSKPMLTNSLVYVGYSLLMGLQGNIDNAAHIGGLVSGFLLGTVMSKSGHFNMSPDQT